MRSALALRLALLRLAFSTATTVTTRYVLGNETGVTSTCSAHFNTPCSIHITHELVDDLVALLAAANSTSAVQAILDRVSAMDFNLPFNFWPSVYSSGGNYLACGRPPEAETSASGDAVPAGSTLTGKSLRAVALLETGIDQNGMWAEITAATSATGDNYYTHVAYDRYPGHSREFHAAAKDAVTRVGYARKVSTPLGDLVVSSSFSDMPNSEAAAQQVCSWK